MRIGTLEELTEFLATELAWRKKELSRVKLWIDRADTEETPSHIRVAICMLYAHWEGFIKAAATGYICYVTRRRLKYSELSYGFVALGLRSRISRVGQSKRAREYVDLISSILSDAELRLSIDCTSAIDTGSNLNSDVLGDILCTFTMDEAPYVTKAPLINQRLLHNRNNIAHGAFLEVDEEAYQGLHLEIIGLIDKFRDDVENAAYGQLYRRSNCVTGTRRTDPT